MFGYYVVDYLGLGLFVVCLLVCLVCFVGLGVLLSIFSLMVMLFCLFLFCFSLF